MYEYGNDSVYNGGVNVWIPGTNYSTISDSRGYWSLDSIPPGVYDFYFYKQGCDTSIRYDFQFVGNGNTFAGYYYLYEIPKANIILDTAYSLIDSESNSLKIIINGRTNMKTLFTFCFDTSENVSKFSENQISYNSVDSSQVFSLITWLPEYMHIQLGQKVYLCAYPGSPSTNTDYRTGKTRIIGLGKQSNVISFIKTK